MAKGQPVLVGTTSIQKNEIVSELLKRKGIKHEILTLKITKEKRRLLLKPEKREQ